MLLGLACLPRSRPPCRHSFARTLAVRLPAAQRLRVIELVVVAGLHVVDLIRGRVALRTCRVAGLAAIAVASQHADAARAPVRRGASLAVACCSRHRASLRAREKPPPPARVREEEGACGRGRRARRAATGGLGEDPSTGYMQWLRRPRSRSIPRPQTCSKSVPVRQLWVALKAPFSSGRWPDSVCVRRVRPSKSALLA